MVAQATITKQGNALVTLFIKQYTLKYGYGPNINRFRAKWGFQDMAQDLGYARACEIVEYYFLTGKHGHPVEHLHNNYEKIAGFCEEKKMDERKRIELRALTEERVKEWEAKNGKR